MLCISFFVSEAPAASVSTCCNRPLCIDMAHYNPCIPHPQNILVTTLSVGAAFQSPDDWTTGAIQSRSVPSVFIRDKVLLSSLFLRVLCKNCLCFPITRSVCESWAPHTTLLRSQPPPANKMHGPAI